MAKGVGPRLTTHAAQRQPDSRGPAWKAPEGLGDLEVGDGKPMAALCSWAQSPTLYTL